MKKWLYFCLFLFPQILAAQGDLKFSGSYRTSPQGGIAEVESGVSAKLWGKGNTTGFVRPFLKGQWSLGYWAAGGGIDLYLLRFLGFRAEYLTMDNSRDYSAFNCLLYRCQDTYKQLTLEGRVYLGLGPFFGKVSWKQVDLNSKLKDIPFVIPTIAMTSTNESDPYQQMEFLLGVKLMKGLSLMYQQQNYVLGQEKGQQRLILMRNAFTPSFAMNFGIGDFDSQIAQSDFMGVLNFSWTLARGYLLE